MPSCTAHTTFLLTLAVILVLAAPAHAFGAGNIASVAKIEGVNWRHGDIEDTLLQLLMARVAGGKKFDKMTVKRVYFGNWLRDYSQAIDVGTVKYVSAEAIRILLWVLGFMTFGYGTNEFEVTADRLGCYRPEDHIDNPKDYADNLDATEYDTRLRGLVDEGVELAIDPQTGLKNYIANERAGCMTSAEHVRKLFTESIQLGRKYARSGNKADLYEALRLMGTGLHCLEDFSAHSNYTELSLIELGEQDVFPHVGADTKIRLPGAQHAVYPCITGTFGGVDFLHSMMGEFDDKATQSEITELEGTMVNSSKGDTSLLKELLSNIPSGIFGNKDQASKADELQENATAAQMNNVRVSPRQPEEFTRHMQDVAKEIYPIIAWHDEVMLSITETIEKIPVLPDLIEQVEEQVNIFVFSLLAPLIVPVIDQIKTELNTGSSEIIESSKDKQLIVFNDDNCSDPTHSMISKDHFSNLLNEPAGQIASQVLKWVVPQLMSCWDDGNSDIDRTINRIINGVFHHPAQRTQGNDGVVDGRRLMFGIVEQWWGAKDNREKQDFRQKLSRDGVLNGQNHKEGVHDTGHGCGKPLGMAKASGNGSNAGAAAMMSGLNSALEGNAGGNTEFGKFAEEAVGGGALGGLVGAIGGSLLGGVFGGKDNSSKAFSNEGYTSSGGYEQQYTEVAHSGNRYAQAQFSDTQLPGGGREAEFKQYEQRGNSGVGFEEKIQQRPTYGGGYEQTNERRFEEPDGRVETETWREGRTADGRHYHEAEVHRKEESGSEDEGHKKHGKHHKKKKHGSDDEEEEVKYEERREPQREEYERGNQGYGGQQREEYGGGRQQGYGEREEGGGERRQEYGRGNQEYGGEQREYGGGRQQEYGGRQQEYGGERQQEYGGGRQQEYGGGRQQEYGGERQQEYGGGRQQEYGERGYGGEQQREERGGGGFGGNMQDAVERFEERFEGGEDDEGRRDGGYGEGGERRRWD